MTLLWDMAVTARVSLHKALYTNTTPCHGLRDGFLDLDISWVPRTIWDWKLLFPSNLLPLILPASGLPCQPGLVAPCKPGDTELKTVKMNKLALKVSLASSFSSLFPPGVPRS